MQLEALLYSIKLNCSPLMDSNIIVIYTGKFDEQYNAITGYTVKLIRENDLKTTLLTFMENKFTCFLCDDDLFYRDFTKYQSYTEQYSKDVLFHDNQVFSFRLGDNIKQGAEVHFNYPISLDGHIFVSKIIKPLIEQIEFENPNQLEARLQIFKNNFYTRYANYSSLVGVPNNRVSDTSGCSHMDGSVDKLNEIFKLGLRIRVQYMHFGEVNNVHKNVEYAYIME